MFSFARLALAHRPRWLAHNWHCVPRLNSHQTQLLRYPFIGLSILHFDRFSASVYIMTGVIYFCALTPIALIFAHCNRDSLTCEAKSASPTGKHDRNPAYSPLFPSILAICFTQRINQKPSTMFPTPGHGPSYPKS